MYNYPSSFFLFGIFLFALSSTYAFTERIESIYEIDSAMRSNNAFIKLERNKIIKDNEVALGLHHQDSIKIYRELSILFAENNDAINACNYLIKYMRSTADLSILNDHVYNNIKDKLVYQNIKKKYEVGLNGWAILYIFSGILGLLIFVALNFRKNLDKTGVFIISLFVLFHSLFILHLSLYVINYHYYVPNSFYASTTFSFLYGPLLYFYFKRVINNYEFRWIDLIHLIPSVVLLWYIMPYYLLSSQEKFEIMFDQENFLLPGANTIIIIKICSLIFYAYLIIRMYKVFKSSNSEANQFMTLWKRNIITIYVSYIVAYLVYAGIITDIINYSPLIHLQILVMVCLVFYVSYIAFVQPEIFKGKITLVDPKSIFKYKKSGLTPSYSKELKDILIHLMKVDKLYKMNDINLEFLSDKLGTTRHNTSQIINEHFEMNFFELINCFRIQEAISILENDHNGNFKIIDVAYEVGYNNKVTFNKAFKKETSFTPTDYLFTLSQRVVSKT